MPGFLRLCRNLLQGKKTSSWDDVLCGYEMPHPAEMPRSRDVNPATNTRSSINSNTGDSGVIKGIVDPTRISNTMPNVSVGILPILPTVATSRIHCLWKMQQMMHIAKISMKI